MSWAARRRTWSTFLTSVPSSAVAARCGSGVRPESSRPRSSSPPQASSSSRTARRRSPQPAPRSERFAPYPGPLMEDLEPGTYEMTPSRDGTDPTALITVPSGWNSWEGPNRFDGHRDGETNEQALARSTWVVGVVVLDVQWVATERCQPTVGAPGRRHGLRPDGRSRPGPPGLRGLGRQHGRRQVCSDYPSTLIRADDRTPPSRSAQAPPSCSAPTPTGASGSGAISTSMSSTSRTRRTSSSPTRWARRRRRCSTSGRRPVLGRVRDAGLRLRGGAPTAAPRSSRCGARGCGTRRTRSCRPRGPRTSRRSTA